MEEVIKVEHSKDEVYDFLYKVMNNKIKDIVISKETNEDGSPKISKVPVTVAARMKAAELLFKSVDSKAPQNFSPVLFVEDI